MANNAPVVTPINKTVFVNSFVFASSLFSVNDADGDSITRYRFFDFSNESTTGLFELDGTPRFNGSQTEIAASDLSKLVYLGGSGISNERIRIQAFDGEDWSDSATVSFAYTVRQNVTKPDVFVNQTSVLSNEYVSAASFISASDPDGYPIEKFMIRDRNANNSFFQLNGQRLTSGKYFEVTADQLEDLRYYSFGGRTSTERVDAFAYDGAAWSDFASADVESRFNENRPTAQFNSVVVPARENIGLNDKIFFSDADGNTAKRIRLYDTSDHDFSGLLTRNGEELAPKRWHEVIYSRLDEFRYTGASRNFGEKIRVRVYDGRYWSPVQTVTFETIDRPVVGTAGNVVESHLENIDLGDLIFQTDDGPSHIAYEIIDASVSPFGGDLTGTLRERGFRRAANRVYRVTPSDLVDNWTFETGTYDDRQLDEVYVRADNGTFFGDWKRINFRSEPEYFVALDSQGSWVNLLQGGNINPVEPVQVTYSFMQQFPDYETGEAVDEPLNDPPRPYRDFFDHQRMAARRVFRQLETFANVEFVEVSDTMLDPITGFRGGKIRMGNYALETDEAAAAFAFLPFGESPQTGDMWFNAYKMDIFTPSQWVPGAASYAVFMHELGHAMGLMHPFDDPLNPDNRPTLPPTTDNEIYTVMSYSGHPSPTNASSFALYDVIDLQIKYGANNFHAAGNDVYGIETTFEGNTDWSWTIWDTGGIDTLTAEGSLIDAIVDLRSGGISTIGSVRNNMSIAFGSIIENGIGSANDDQIFGNEAVNNLNGGLGDDFLRGLGGNDMMIGGGGNDTYEWGIADGDDIIDEQQGAGLDTLRITQLPFVDDFSTDLTFRKSGRDLIIDLNIDQGLSQGDLTITNQKWGAYQVESLQFGDTRVDLRELYNIATSTATRYRVLEESTSFGNLVAPI